MMCLLQMRDAKSEDSLKRRGAGVDAVGFQNCNVDKEPIHKGSECVLYKAMKYSG